MSHTHRRSTPWVNVEKNKQLKRARRKIANDRRRTPHHARESLDKNGRTVFTVTEKLDNRQVAEAMVMAAIEAGVPISVGDEPVAAADSPEHIAALMDRMEASDTASHTDSG